LPFAYHFLPILPQQFLLKHTAQLKSFRILKDSGVHTEVPVLSGAILSILSSFLALMSLLEATRIICYEFEQVQTVQCIKQQIMGQIYNRFCCCIINSTQFDQITYQGSFYLQNKNG